MQNKVIRSLSFGRRALLVTAVGAAIGAPLGVGLLNAPRVVAQGAAVGASLKFEVASIKPSPAERVKPSQVVNPGGILFSHVTLGDCIMAAYGLESRQISGPDWITEDRFDISARSGKAAARDEVMLMLQSLLSDRFKLAFHRTKKDMEAYLLGIGKGELKLRPSKEEGVMNSRIIPGGLSMQHASISDLLAMIRGVVGAPIADSTGLSGRYDFDLIVLDTQDTSDVAAIKMAMVQGGPDRWAEAVARLGLKLESKKVPMDILVIAHAEKPSENPSGRF